MGIEYQKAKSVGKTVTVKGPRQKKLVLDTMRMVADLVGSTLGPGGMPVLIERQEHNLPPMVTKDGVTVFRALGFDDSSSQVIMEAARDASIRTASEAGDGTTTATVLAEAIVRRVYDYCEKHPEVPPQKVVRRLHEVFNKIIEPLIRTIAKKADLTDEAGKKLLWNVAKISANGDQELASAVMQCFDLVGDEGNVTITEVNGPSKYEVERIEGYPIPIGYDDSCAKYASNFINDPALQRTVFENPAFIVYHGRITEIQTVQFLLEKIGQAWQEHGFRHNVVLIATGFSESVLANLAVNFQEATTINVLPVLAPMSPVPYGQLGFLEDLCVVTGATLLDPLNRPFASVDIDCCGNFAKTFEIYRFRSVVISDMDEPEEGDLSEDAQAKRAHIENQGLVIEEQVEKLKNLSGQAASILDSQIYQERIGKLTGGLAKLRVVGSSNGELRERRDRAEDAICAVRGAIKHGVLPGGGWTLLRCAVELQDLETKPEHTDVRDPMVEVLVPALKAPVEKLFANLGMNEEEIRDRIKTIIESMEGYREPETYDAYEGKYVNWYKGGVLDSVPAVLEAIRNSLSIASLLGALGGTVVFARDRSFDTKEAHAVGSFLRDAESGNPADERAM